MQFSRHLGIPGHDNHWGIFQAPVGADFFEDFDSGDTCQVEVEQDDVWGGSVQPFQGFFAMEDDLGNEPGSVQYALK